LNDEQTMQEGTDTTVPPVKVKHIQGEPSKLRTTLTRVAWMSILLGLVIEALLVASRLGAFTLEATAAELANRVSWSVIVCAGLAIGDAIAESSRPFLLGLSGLVGAPLAFAVARGAHKATADLMEIAQPADPISPLLSAGIRGVEYMCLGLVIFWLKKQPQPTVMGYMAVGLVVGLIFGSVLLMLNPAATTSVSSMLVWAVNELAFPVGCTLVLYASTAIGEKVAA